jgi:hypothetical protein
VLAVIARENGGGEGRGVGVRSLRKSDLGDSDKFEKGGVKSSSDKFERGGVSSHLAYPSTRVTQV